MAKRRTVIACGVAAALGPALAGCRSGPRWRAWPTETITEQSLRAAGMHLDGPTVAVSVALNTRATAVDVGFNVTIRTTPRADGPAAAVTPVLLPWRMAPWWARLLRTVPVPRTILGELSDCDAAIRLYAQDRSKIGAAVLFFGPSETPGLSAQGTIAEPRGETEIPASWGLALDCRPRPAPVAVDWP